MRSKFEIEQPAAKEEEGPNIAVDYTYCIGYSILYQNYTNSGNRASFFHLNIFHTLKFHIAIIHFEMHKSNIFGRNKKSLNGLIIAHHLRIFIIIQNFGKCYLHTFELLVAYR